MMRYKILFFVVKLSKDHNIKVTLAELLFLSIYHPDFPSKQTSTFPDHTVALGIWLSLLL